MHSVRLNETMAACPWDTDCIKAYSVCFKHYWPSRENTIDQGPWGAMELTHMPVHFHKDTLVHQWMWLVVSRFMSAPGTLSLVISGAPCLLDHAGLPTHSHLSVHSSDEITQTGISAVFLFFVVVFACVLMWYSLNAVNEGGQLSLYVFCVDVSLAWETNCRIFFACSLLCHEWIQTTKTGVNTKLLDSVHYELIHLICSVIIKRNSLQLITLQNHLLNNPRIS